MTSASNPWAWRFLLGMVIVVGVAGVIFGGEEQFTDTGYKLIGGGILAAVLLQVCLTLFSSMQRSSAEKNYQLESLQLLRAEVDRANAKSQAEQAKSSLSWNGLRKFRIDRKVPEGGDICSFYLVPHDGKGFPPFDPGQYLTFQLKIPTEEKPIIRCYSLSDSPLETAAERSSDSSPAASASSAVSTSSAGGAASYSAVSSSSSSSAGSSNPRASPCSASRSPGSSI